MGYLGEASVEEIIKALSKDIVIISGWLIWTSSTLALKTEHPSAVGVLGVLLEHNSDCISAEISQGPVQQHLGTLTEIQ